MEILLLGGLNVLRDKLQELGHEVVYAPDCGAIPSLTALLLERPKLAALAVRADQAGRWSDGHILAAAKLLQERGRLVLVGTGAERLEGSTLLFSVDTEEAALKLLTRPRGGAAAMAAAKKPDGGGGPVVEREPVFTAQPLKISRSRVLMIDVVGSQPRMGCTTQAIGLWHYFKALGLSPAVVMEESQVRLLAETVSGAKRIDGGCRINGISFITNTQQPYDCYIRDGGFGRRMGHENADAVVLVAGAKPWELSNTMQAARTLQQSRSAVIFSFTGPREVPQLGPLVHNIPAEAAPYMPDPWARLPAMLLIYDRLLRPMLEREPEENLEEEIPCLDEAQETLS